MSFNLPPPVSEYTTRDLEILWYLTNDSLWTLEERSALLNYKREQGFGVSEQDWRVLNGFNPNKPLANKTDFLRFFSWNCGYTLGQLIRLYTRAVGDELTEEDRDALRHLYQLIDNKQITDADFLKAGYDRRAFAPHVARQEALRYLADEDVTVVVFNKNIVMDNKGRFVVQENQSLSKKNFDKIVDIYPGLSLRGVVGACLKDLVVNSKGKVDLSQLFFSTLEAIRIEDQKVKLQETLIVNYTTQGQVQSGGLLSQPLTGWIVEEFGEEEEEEEDSVL